jgi:hypothetical protein
MKAAARRAVFLLCVVVLASVRSAAAQVSTGEIFGKVTDDTGAVLPGVTVTLTSSALIQPETASTAVSGAFRFPNLPIGTYSVAFELTGFKKTIREGIIIQAGFNAEINTKLDLSSVQETVTVTGESPVIDTKSTSIASNFDRVRMDAIPSARDPWVILEQTPGMVMDRQNVGGNQSGQQSSFLAHGSSSNQQWNLDGATITDMASDGSPFYFDFDAFEEIQITTGGQDASQDAGGVAINFVTKSGSNTLKGSSRYYVTDQKFESNNVTAALLAQGAGAGNPIQNIQEYGVEAGGPIVKNKAWFWGAANRNPIKVGVVGFLIDPKGDPNSRDNLRTDLTVISNQSAKINYQWAPGHKSTFLFTRDDKTRGSRGASNLRPIETTTPQTAPSNLYQADHQWIVTDRMMLTGKYTHSSASFLLDFHDPALATVQPTFDIMSNLNGRSGTQTNNIRPSQDARLDGTYFRSKFLGGDHSAKFGLRWHSTPIETITKTGGGATARFSNGVPAEASITRDGDTSRDLYSYSTYFNDSYKRGRGTLNWGLRFDHQKDRGTPTHIAANPILPDLLPAINFPGADSHVAYDDLSPRLGFTFDLSGNGKSVLKTTAARYYGLGVSTATTLSPTGQTTLRFPWRDLNGDGFVQRNELDLTRLLAFSTNYDPNNPTSLVSPRAVDPNLKNDITDEVIVGVDHELMANFGVSASYIWRRYDQFQATYVVDSLEHSSDFVPVTITASCGNASCGQSKYTVTYWQLPFTEPAQQILRNNKQRRSYQGVELTARKRFSRRWMMNAALTLNDTKYFYLGGADVDYKDPTNIAQKDGFQVGTLNARWVGKLSGLYALPWGMSVAGFFNARQGFPYVPTIQTPTRTGSLGRADVYTEPFGTHRYQDFYTLDAHFDKAFVFGRRKIVGNIDVFNLGNAATVLDRGNTSTAGEVRQNTPLANNVTTILAPRVVRFGLRIVF